PVEQAATLIAVARFDASVARVLLMAKLPVNVGATPEQAFVPSLPAEAAAQEKLPKASVPDKVSVPGTVAVIVVTPAAAVAVAPTAGKEPLQELIASRRLAAAVPTVVLLTKVPTVALVHPFVAEPPLSVPPDQTKPLVKVLVSKILFPADPGVEAARVTTPALEVAITPVPALALIAVVRLVASVATV